MRLPPVSVFLCAVACAAHAQVAEPDAARQGAILSQMRAAALNYSDRLQDFICLQSTSRSVDESGTSRHWKPLETQELELAYIAHKEYYKLLKVDGKTSNLEKRVKQGYFTPSGEFGSKLRQIFDPEANAEFTWDHAELSAGKPSCVFRYNVPLAATTLMMQVNLQRVKLGHHGLVYADCETGAITRFQMISDAPTIHEQGHDIQIGTQTDMRYGPVMIGSREFLLPQSAEEIARYYKRLTRAEIRFEQYRKYESSSTVTFDGPPKY